ncbi:MAG: PA14 domain-containing protein [Planctomycetes bacterium]|jgi:hypothetical protein|nr:PA14 domain-containing protein [Planctomycetota bacterium]
MSSKPIAWMSLILSCLVSVRAAAVPDPDVGWWRFDEGAGDTAADSSGKGHPGTIQGATWVDGGWNGLGWCLDFDGNDDRVELGVIDVQGAGITLAAWVQPDSFNINDGRVISKASEWGENDHWWMLSTINKSFLRFRLKTQGQATTTLIASQGEIKLGEWQHAAATWDGTRMRLYRNAVEVANGAKAGSAVATDPAVRAAIASQPKGAYATDPLHANKFFDGRIDEVRIYSSALSVAQLQELIQGLHPIAWKPDPAHGTEGVLQPLLRWNPSETAVTHDVYLGTTPDLGPAQRVGSRQAVAMYWHVPGFTPGTTYYWRVDEIDATGNVATGRVWMFVSASLTAYKPQPADGAKWIDPQGLTLTWSPGMNAVAHDVYFGTSQPDVAGGTGDTLKKAKQLPTSFGPGVLQPGTAYYWRVDEIVVDGSKKTGPVWSFTTLAPGGGLKGEYFSNPDLTGEPVLVRVDPGVKFAWGTTGPGAPLPGTRYSVRWSGDLEAAFTETYTISVYADDGVKLWFNGELVVDKWFGQEAGSPKYSVKVALEAGQRYPLVLEYFFNSGSAVAELSWESPRTPAQIIPAGALSLLLRAYSPNPTQHAINVRQTPVLSWRAGEKAAMHDVYFGDNRKAVAGATTTNAAVYQGRQKLDVTTFAPAALEWNKTYFWRVDEVNDARADSPWTGSVWDFTSASFVVVDDFEIYTDDEGNRIYETWIDGWTNGTGSLVGYLEAREGTFGERQTVFGGKQSMPLAYDNRKAPYCSQADHTRTKPQDWTVNGVSTLVLHVKGKTDNGADPLYVILEDSAGHVGTVAHPDVRIAVSTMWNEWAIPLSSFAGVNPATIKKMSIGLGQRGATAPGGQGMLFIDDLWVTKK